GTEGVGVRGGFGATIKYSSDIARPQTSTPLVDEYRLTGTGHVGPTGVQPLLHGPNGPIMDRDPALFAALAQHGDRAAAQVDAGPVETAELGDPQAGRIEQLEHRQITLVERRGHGTIQEGSDLPAREDARQATPPRRRPQGPRRVGIDAALPDAPGE